MSDINELNKQFSIKDLECKNIGVVLSGLFPEEQREELLKKLKKIEADKDIIIQKVMKILEFNKLNNG